MKLNNKGFTIIEVMATVIILSLLVIIIVPNVKRLIQRNNENNYKNFEKSIINATKILLSDYRYDILIDGNCNTSEEIKNIKMIGKYTIDNSRISVKILIDENNLTTSKDNNIYNPMNAEEILDIDNSYINIKYQCENKKFIYDIEKLTWKQKND